MADGPQVVLRLEVRTKTWWLYLGATTLTLLACNEILDNRKGLLRRDVAPTEAPPTQPTTPAGEIATPPEASEATASHDAASDAATDAAMDAGTPCPPGPGGVPSKLCGPECALVDDPRFGCASPDCTPCSFDYAAATCVAGRCAIYQCAPGRGDCNADASDGCEANLNLLTSCGACGLQCPGRPHALPVCVMSTCTITCEGGTGNCNNDDSDGCETDLSTDSHHCGQCGKPCVLGQCVDGGCAVL